MKALVLFSGGLDSSVCLGMAAEKYGADEVLALSIYYGQKHKKEMQASEEVAAYYGVKRITLDLGEILRIAAVHFCKARLKKFPMKIMQHSWKKQMADL